MNLLVPFFSQFTGAVSAEHFDSLMTECQFESIRAMCMYICSAKSALEDEKRNEVGPVLDPATSSESDERRKHWVGFPKSHSKFVVFLVRSSGMYCCASRQVLRLSMSRANFILVSCSCWLGSHSFSTLLRLPWTSRKHIR